jgi:hypothetical protein
MWSQQLNESASFLLDWNFVCIFFVLHHKSQSQKHFFYQKMPGIVGSWYYCTSNLLITCLPTKLCRSFHHELRVSPMVLSMWPCKNIFHIQVLVIYFFLTPPRIKKKKTGTANKWGTTNSKPPWPISILWFSSSNCTVCRITCSKGRRGPHGYMWNVVSREVLEM